MYYVYIEYFIFYKNFLINVKNWLESSNGIGKTVPKLNDIKIKIINITKPELKLSFT